MAQFFTNAPDCYDYSYVQTLGPAKAGNCRGDWRLIEVSDTERFAAYQMPRYMSGLFVAVAASDAASVSYFQLSSDVTGERCRA